MNANQVVYIFLYRIVSRQRLVCIYKRCLETKFLVHVKCHDNNNDYQIKGVIYTEIPYL